MNLPDMSSEFSEIKLAIVCPMANEAETAENFVSAVLDQCKGFEKRKFFIIIDRASKDNTLDILNKLQKSETDLEVIYAPENKNVVDAYLRGYKEALKSESDWILEIDGGFSHNPEEVPRFFYKMLEGYDCVFGSRFSKGGGMEKSPLSRYMLSYGGTKLVNILLGTKLSDMTSGFELFNRKSLKYVLEKGIRSKGHFFQTEIKLHCHNFQIAEVPIHYQSASSSVTRSVIFDSLKNLALLTSQRFKPKNRIN